MIIMVQLELGGTTRPHMYTYDDVRPYVHAWWVHIYKQASLFFLFLCYLYLSTCLAPGALLYLLQYALRANACCAHARSQST